MRELLTPKQVARALDVSESSVKRWCDKGLLATQYTPGRHRRIRRAAVVDFLRRGKHRLVRPEALGLPATCGRTQRVVQRARDQLTEALIGGDEGRCRQITFDLYLHEHLLSVICDDVFAAAFRQIGERWACGDAEVYQERRGCEITLRVLHELRGLLPPTAGDAPVAFGAAAEGDQYTLGTTMAELVLRNGGWNATSLGDNLPFPTLAAAIAEHRPRLFWLSCSHIADPAAFLDSYNGLFHRFHTASAFVVGGFALTEPIRQQMKYSAYCESMQRLESFAHTLNPIAARDVPRQDKTGQN